MAAREEVLMLDSNISETLCPLRESQYQSITHEIFREYQSTETSAAPFLSPLPSPNTRRPIDSLVSSDGGEEDKYLVGK